MLLGPVSRAVGELWRVAGVCHAKGSNSEIPPYWIVYLMIENLDRSLDAVRAGGGAVVSGPRSAGSSGRYCIIRDPAGAYIGLFEGKPGDDQ